MDKLVSVILPVYGVEKYLPECVDSLLAQSYQNLEIILVDDFLQIRNYKTRDESRFFAGFRFEDSLDIYLYNIAHSPITLIYILQKY